MESHMARARFIQRTGFTLLEMAVATFFALAISAFTVPAVIEHHTRNHEAEANRNAAAILRAVRLLSAEAEGDYLSPKVSRAQIRSALGGLIPINPCTGERDLYVDYGFKRTADVIVIQPSAGSRCNPDVLDSQVIFRL